METAGTIVFVVSAIVILAMPTVLLWMLFHAHGERCRWRNKAKHDMRQVLKKERREQAALLRERARRKQMETEQAEQEGELRRSDGHGASQPTDPQEKKEQQRWS